MQCLLVICHQVCTHCDTTRPTVKKRSTSSLSTTQYWRAWCYGDPQINTHIASCTSAIILREAPDVRHTYMQRPRRQCPPAKTVGQNDETYRRFVSIAHGQWTTVWLYKTRNPSNRTVRASLSPIPWRKLMYNTHRLRRFQTDIYPYWLNQPTPTMPVRTLVVGLRRRTSCSHQAPSCQRIIGTRHNRSEQKSTRIGLLPYTNNNVDSLHISIYTVANDEVQSRKLPSTKHDPPTTVKTKRAQQHDTFYRPAAGWNGQQNCKITVNENSILVRGSHGNGAI